MKKLLFFAPLGLAAAGSWASYPRKTAPAGYLMVVGSGWPGTSSAVPEIIIQPDGQRQVQPVYLLDKP